VERTHGRVQQEKISDKKYNNFRLKFRNFFEFDPLENIDRSEDGNNPQDIDSLGGGEGGLFGRVPGEPQVGAAN
jgi:hypothetical protein